jgi:hypothetical protein
METAMQTIDSPPVTQEQADSREIMRLVSEGKRVTDPELRRRVTERADAARRLMLERHGVMDIAVDLIRESRDED